MFDPSQLPTTHCHGCGVSIDRGDVCHDCALVFEHDWDTWDNPSAEAAALRRKISVARDALRIAAGKRPRYA